ncbi:calcium permease [Anopheles sinensis]|uniref:Calcium permease n=1 Tax=Anopheles sinensis TaxID=74873 RepID=A0A084VM54_ANOSI|nr:calcium permease [Anopheles sinensis]
MRPNCQVCIVIIRQSRSMPARRSDGNPIQEYGQQQHPLDHNPLSPDGHGEAEQNQQGVLDASPTIADSAGKALIFIPFAIIHHASSPGIEQ